MKKVIKLKSKKPWVGVDPHALPTEFISQINQVIRNAFKDKIGEDEFLICGNIYPKEVVLSCSLRHGKSVRMTTAYASLDYVVGQDKTLEKKLYAMVDFFGNFFNEFFQNDRQFSYEDIWTEYSEGNDKFFVRINRDNVELESSASELLGDTDEED